jgi:hypothetical protein
LENPNKFIKGENLLEDLVKNVVAIIKGMMWHLVEYAMWCPACGD